MATGLVQAAAPESIITTIAGNGRWEGPQSDGDPATSVKLIFPNDVAKDKAGNVYISVDRYIRKVDANGIITTIAGNGTYTDIGNGTPATNATVNAGSLELDRNGNLLIVEGLTHRIRKLSPAGVITPVAGTGTQGFSGDGGPATQANFSSPYYVAVDSVGNLFVSDSGNNRIRKISTTGIVTTVAGNGTAGTDCTGDGALARNIGLATVRGIALDRNDTLHFVSGNCIRKVSSNGIISTIAGGGPYRSDPIATHMRLTYPTDLDFDSRGNLYVVEPDHLVRMVTPAGFIRVVAGDFADGNSAPVGNNGFRGDGGPAVGARLNGPRGIDIDAQDNLYISDNYNYRVRKVTPTTDEPPLTGVDAFSGFQVREIDSVPFSVVVGDLTADKRTDVVLTTLTNPAQSDPVSDFKAYIFVQQSDGTLGDPVKISYPSDTANTGGELAVGDFNNDGINDVAVGHHSGVLVIAGSRTANFIAHSFNGGFNLPAPGTLIAMDADRDGWLDVVTLTSEQAGNFPDGYVNVGFGGPGGVMTRNRRTRVIHGNSAYPNAYELKSGYFNADAYPDLLHMSGSILQMLLSDGAGGYVESQIKDNSSSIKSPMIGQFNADRYPDVAYLIPDAAPESRLIVDMRGDQRLPVYSTVLRSYNAAGAAVAADINGDGLDDVLVAHYQTDAITYHQQSKYGLRDGIKYRVPTGFTLSRQALAVGDVNGDGCNDLAIANPDIGLVTLRGKGCSIRVNGSQPLLRPSTGPVPPASIQAAIGSIQTHNALNPLLETQAREVLNGSWQSDFMRSRAVRFLSVARIEGLRIGVRALASTLMAWSTSWKLGLEAVMRMTLPTIATPQPSGAKCEQSRPVPARPRQSLTCEKQQISSP